MSGVGADKSCACTGIRVCAVCEPARGHGSEHLADESILKFRYCSICGIAWRESLDEGSFAKSIVGFRLRDVIVTPDLITTSEEERIASSIDRDPWKLSQSGRRKQDFGPAVNFKKRKFKLANYSGLPGYARIAVEKFSVVPELEGFVPVEQGNLEYVQERGSANDPHIDDPWAWGERLVTLSLLSDSAMTFSRKGALPELIADLVQVDKARELQLDCGCAEAALKTFVTANDATSCGTGSDQVTVHVKVPLPRRSLLGVSRGPEGAASRSMYVT